MNDEWSDGDDEDDDEYEIYYKQHYNVKIYTENMYIRVKEYAKKYNIFVLVEKIFTEEIDSYKDEYINLIGICYNIQCKRDLIQFGDRIQQIFPYNTLGNYDLYLTLIFIYYSLLGEPGEEIFTGQFFLKYAFNEKLVTNLYFILTTNDLLEHNGNNLSRDVRKYFLGL